MSARDKLAEVIARADSYAASDCGGIHWQNMADKILAAGYRLPRTITAAEERASIQPGTIAVDLDGNAWKRGIGSWVSTGGDTPALYDDMDITLTILHEPAS